MDTMTWREMKEWADAPAVEAQYKAMIGMKQQRVGNKYNAKKTEVDGIVFDSKREAARYGELKMLQDSYEYTERITGLKLQPEFVLQESFKDSQGKTHRAIKYRADFQYTQNGHTIVEDVKGKETPVFKLKAKMFIKRYPGLIFRVTK